jgi:hypothetical protein
MRSLWLVRGKKDMNSTYQYASMARRRRERLKDMIQEHYVGYCKLGMSFLIITTLWISLLGQGGCVSQERAMLKKQILIDSRGREIDRPTLRVFSAISDSPPEQRPIVIASLVDVIQKSPGYSRFVAARGLLWFFAERHDLLITKDVVAALGQYCVRATMLSNSHAAPTGGANWNIPVSLTCGVETDSDVWLPLASTPLPKGWMVKNVIIKVDGNGVISALEDSSTGVVGVVNMETVLGNRIMGKHEWECEFTLIAPNKISATVRRESSFTVSNAADLK